MEIPMVIILGAAVLYSAAHRGSDWPGIVLGIMLGVVGYNTFVGDLVRALISAVSGLF
jgi:fructose-specific phosphotransferase system IIC component